jgi:hypothetical protein
MGFIDRGGDSVAGVDDHHYDQNLPWCSSGPDGSMEFNTTVGNATRHCPVL